jgi:hypothetical protein
MDYRSVGTGKWNSLSSWQYYDANNVWRTPTITQGYPGQFSGTGVVTIRDSHVITLDVNLANNFTSLIVGEGVSGTLFIGSDVIIPTLSVTINKGAIMKFGKNLGVTLPANASLIINSPGKVDSDVNCTNNNAIYIGLIKFSTCNGQGNSEFSFDEINLYGGTLNARPTSNPSYCENSILDLRGDYSGGVGSKNIDSSTKGVNFLWSIRNPNGVITNSSLQNPTYTATIAGTYTATLTCTTYYNNKVYSNSKTITMVVNPKPLTPLVGSVTTIDCNISSGSVQLSGLPSGNWVINPGGISGSSNTKIITGLAAGQYSFTVTNESGCVSAPTAIVLISDKSSTKWTFNDGVGNWSNGIPTVTTNVVIAGNYEVAASSVLKVCSLTINNGFALTVKDKGFVVIQNDLNVNTGAKLEIENQGSLVMINDTGIVTNNGSIKVNKTTTPFERYDYTYWSSPITTTPINNNVGSTFANWRTDYAFSFHPENFIDANGDGFDDDGNDYIRASAMDVPGRGYVIMGSTSLGSYPATQSVIFTANTPANKLNTGTIKTEIALTPGLFNDDDFNLIGNPYPSAIDADKFINTNKDKIDGTLYFWTHKMDISAKNPGPDALNFSSDDYAVYNLSGGTGTSGSTVDGVEQSNKPKGYIASGQGFFVEAQVTGNVIFNNAMRVTESVATANTQFYKSVVTKDKKETKDRVWLNFENTTGVFSQQLVAYLDNTTNDYDSGYDGLLSDGGNYVNFYSFIKEDKYKIQGRKKFNESDDVNLGYFSGISGEFNINIDAVEGVFDDENVEIVLEDKLTGFTHDLRESPYNFTTDKGTFNERFILHFVNKKEVVKVKEDLNSNIVVFNTNNQLKVNSTKEKLQHVEVYDLLGKVLFSADEVNSNELVVDNLEANNQLLLFKISLTNGDLILEKTVF